MIEWLCSQGGVTAWQIGPCRSSPYSIELDRMILRSGSFPKLLLYASAGSWSRRAVTGGSNYTNQNSLCASCARILHRLPVALRPHYVDIHYTQL